jgi:MmoB/DmpM family
MSSQGTFEDHVGPVLEAGETARAVIDAIRRLNEGVEVRDRGSYLRVLVRRRCRVTREAIEHTLGRPFRLPGDLEIVMPSFKGMFRVTDDEAVWEAGRP